MRPTTGSCLLQIMVQMAGTTMFLLRLMTELTLQLTMKITSKTLVILLVTLLGLEFSLLSTLTQLLELKFHASIRKELIHPMLLCIKDRHLTGTSLQLLTLMETVLSLRKVQRFVEHGKINKISQSPSKHLLVQIILR